MQHTIIGDRTPPPGTTDAPPITADGPFRLLHAVTIQTLLKLSTESHQLGKKKTLTPEHIVARINDNINKRLTTLYTTAKRRKQTTQFIETWILTGATHWKGGIPRNKLLNPIDPTPDEHTLHIFTDGAGNSPKYKKEAGWGIVIINKEDPKTSIMKWGRVITDEKHKDYIRAEESTNNSGELTALYVALLEARDTPAPSVHIHTDSLWSILKLMNPNTYKKSNSTHTKNIIALTRALLHTVIQKKACETYTSSKSKATATTHGTKSQTN